jgi:TonB family protein
MRNTNKILLLSLILCLVSTGLHAQKMLLAFHSKPKKSQILPTGIAIRQAQFPDFAAYCKTHLEYPQQARENGIEGRVIAKVTVSASGKISEVQIVQKLGFDCDEAVLKLLKEMPNWNPAVQNGQAVAQKVYVPLFFHLGGGQ